MTVVYKTFTILFLALQLLVVLKAVPSQVNFRSYFAEIATSVLCSITKVNHLYNFFTDPDKTGSYSYTSNELVLYQVEKDHVDQKVLTRDGSLKTMVTACNQARVSHLQSIATRDTALYNAVVRSQALYCISKYRTYPLLSVEVFHHRCEAIRKGNRFEKVEYTDTVYSNLFSIIAY
ncbi:hypothetical protein [Parapedobacter tibetensis]|uniref:hypothetical protein n=1 Tax=Parapedobacter tibetensis TaxID=2972951 RepID=UPI00214D8E0D|nr:hypothetical protein [Parapedobacter tibetensis]